MIVEVMPSPVERELRGWLVRARTSAPAWPWRHRPNRSHPVGARPPRAADGCALRDGVEPSLTCPVSGPAGTIFGFSSIPHSTSGSRKSHRRCWTSPSGPSSNCHHGGALVCRGPRAPAPRPSPTVPTVEDSAVAKRSQNVGNSGKNGSVGRDLCPTDSSALTASAVSVRDPLDHETVARFALRWCGAMRRDGRRCARGRRRDTRESG